MNSMNTHCLHFVRGSFRAVLALAVALAAAQALAQPKTPSFADARNRMVDEEIVAPGVKDPRVIAAMRATPRHEFVPLPERKNSYIDMALPIGEAQTISPPFVVATMTEQLEPKPTDVVLEIGTGSGYQAAVLSPLVKEVYTIEIVAPLGQRAAEALRRLNYRNVFCKIGDGYQGWPEHAPFDKIIVTCSPERVPSKLVEQLKEGGRMVIPVGERYQQTMYLLKKVDGKLVTEALRPTLFVPMTGTAEKERKILPDPAKPELRNGDFEELMGDPPKPVGWHYQRQVEFTSAEKAPSGKHCAYFHNTNPGQYSQILQGFVADGRKVKQLEITLQVKAQEARPAQNGGPKPRLNVTFYDERRAIIGHSAMGPWVGSFPWEAERQVIPVPSRSRDAIIAVGLLGGVGELWVDDIRLRAVK